MCHNPACLSQDSISPNESTISPSLPHDLNVSIQVVHEPLINKITNLDHTIENNFSTMVHVHHHQMPMWFTKTSIKPANAINTWLALSSSSSASIETVITPAHVTTSKPKSICLIHPHLKNWGPEGLPQLDWFENKEAIADTVHERFLVDYPIEKDRFIQLFKQRPMNYLHKVHTNLITTCTYKDIKSKGGFISFFSTAFAYFFIALHIFI